MIIDKLIPNVDQRLSSWISIQERLARRPQRQPKPTITISRQFGCEGYPLADSLKQALEKRSGEVWTIFDQMLIERVSRETDLSERLLGNLGDATQAVDKFVTLIPKWQTHSEAYEVLTRYILRIAQEGNAIIVGRGGAVVTEHLPRCFHFRLEAPFEHRVQSIQRRLAVSSQQEAERIVREHEKTREHFLESFLHCSIADTRYYNAVFNTSKNTLDAITRSILELVPVAP